MTFVSELSDFEKHLPVVGDINHKSPFAYQVTRGMVTIVNALQMALAESYINGLEIPDSALKSILDTFIPILYKYFPSLLVSYDWLLAESDCLAEGSQELMAIQYNLPTEMFRLMLGERQILYPKYTMALWEQGAIDLEQAQMHMLDDVIEKVQIKDGDQILDLGCGWGSSAHYILAKFPHAKVTALNLSHEQCEYMRQKRLDPNSCFSSERFTICEEDFNQANFETKFDKIIAIGLFEHLGNLTDSLHKLSSFLKDDGQVFLHFISIRLPHNAYSPFLNKYIFPRMRVWCYDAVPRHDRDLKTIDRWYLNGSNYSQTLQQWLKNFDSHQDQIKTLNYGMDYAKFRRIWRLYLIWCIAYFDACQGEILGNAQYLLRHQQLRPSRAMKTG